jgi:hypothetical protein
MVTQTLGFIDISDFSFLKFWRETLTVKEHENCKQTMCGGRWQVVAGLPAKNDEDRL